MHFVPCTTYTIPVAFLLRPTWVVPRQILPVCCCLLYSCTMTTDDSTLLVPPLISSYLIFQIDHFFRSHGLLPTGDDSHVSHAQRVDAVVLRRRVWYCPKQNKSSHELLRFSAAVHTFLSLLVFPPVLRFLGSRDHWKLCSIHGEPSVEHS